METTEPPKPRPTGRSTMGHSVTVLVLALACLWLFVSMVVDTNWILLSINLMVIAGCAIRLAWPWARGQLG